jgi:YidC/Oxa1 family membrane protein insertase
MNIRNIYFVLIIALSLGLLFQWSSEKRNQSVEEHLIAVSSPSFEIGEDYVAIESKELYVVVAVETGAIVETRLKDYRVENVDGSLGFRVFGESKESAFSYYFKSGFTGLSPSYQIAELGTNYLELVDPLLGVSKRVSFMDATYEISIYDSSINGEEGKSFAGLYRTAGGALDLKRDALSGGMMNNSSYEGVAISSDGDPYSTSRLRSVGESVEVLSRSGWVAFIQKYFFAAILGSDDYIYNYYVLPKESGLFRMGYTVEGSSGSNVTYDHEHRLFVGPKIRKDLMGRADNLELSIDMGWFWFLSQPMVWFMDVLNGYINNWGLTIIIFTVLIKLLFWPITAKSFRSMANLRKITPELNEIKERYKDDRQKQGTETMKLMKKKWSQSSWRLSAFAYTNAFFYWFLFCVKRNGRA